MNLRREKADRAKQPSRRSEKAAVAEKTTVSFGDIHGRSLVSTWSIRRREKQKSHEEDWELGMAELKIPTLEWNLLGREKRVWRRDETRRDAKDRIEDYTRFCLWVWRFKFARVPILHTSLNIYFLFSRILRGTLSQGAFSYG